MSVAAHELLATRLCIATACTQDADRDDGLCAYHREHPQRRAHTKGELLQMFENDTTPTPTSAAHVDVPCKVDGCKEPATGRASFSGLCDTHKAEEASRRASRGHASHPRTGGGNVSPPEPVAADTPAPASATTEPPPDTKAPVAITPLALIRLINDLDAYDGDDGLQIAYWVGGVNDDEEAGPTTALVRALARDVQQEALIALWIATLDWDPERGAGFVTFAKLVIHRRLQTVVTLANRLKNRALNESIRQVLLDHELADATELIEATSGQPERDAIAREQLHRILDLLPHLTEIEQRAIVGVTVGATYAEIGGDRKSVDNAVQRARAKLRRAA